MQVTHALGEPRLLATVSWSTFEDTMGILQHNFVHAVAAKYPHSTCNSTLTCIRNSHSALCESHIASQAESGCVYLQWL